MKFKLNQFEAILFDFDGVIGDTMGDNFKEDSWSFRLQSKPFIRWIWLGALLITLGTFISSINLIRKQS